MHQQCFHMILFTGGLQEKQNPTIPSLCGWCPLQQTMSGADRNNTAFKNKSWDYSILVCCCFQDQRKVVYSASWLASQSADWLVPMLSLRNVPLSFFPGQFFSFRKWIGLPCKLELRHKMNLYMYKSITCGLNKQQRGRQPAWSIGAGISMKTKP